MGLHLTAASISSSVLRETFKVDLTMTICLKSSKFVCLLLKFGCLSWFSAGSPVDRYFKLFLYIVLSTSRPLGAMSLDPQSVCLAL
jgi:hypothetical protein